MRLFFNKVLLFFILLFNFVAFAQQEALFTQYMYNTSIINPAYSGSRGVLTIFGQYRSQWVGVDGAPKTATFTIHSPIKNSKLGYGVSFTNDKLGVMNDNSLAVDLSYTITVNNDYKIAFGLKGTANFLNIEYENLTIYDPTEEIENVQNQFNPNLGVGAYFYSDKAYLGISIPYLLEYDFLKDQTYASMNRKMHTYLMAGYVFDFSDDVKFKPAMLARFVEGAPLLFDISGNILFRDRFTLGASYRLNSSISALAGLQVSDQFFIGYSYDSSVTKLAVANTGSHEILLRFELFNRNRRFTSPRFF